MNSCGHRRSSWFRCSPGRSGVQLLFDSFADHAGVMTTQTALASDRAPSGRYHPSAVQDDDPAAQSNASGDTGGTSWEASGPLADDRPATDSVIAERLWDAMHRAHRRNRAVDRRSRGRGFQVLPADGPLPGSLDVWRVERSGHRRTGRRTGPGTCGAGMAAAQQRRIQAVRPVGDHAPDQQPMIPDRRFIAS